MTAVDAERTKQPGEPGKLFRLREMLVAGAVLLIAAAAYVWLHTPQHDGAYVHIYHQNENIMRLPLDADGIFFVTGLPVQVEILGGRAAVIRSDCPDQICVRQGFISGSGQMAVCLPNRLVLRIVGAVEDVGLDAVAW